MTSEKNFFRKIYLSLYLKALCEIELETKQNCNILTPTLMAISISFPFSSVAQLEARGPSSLLSAGFLYRILSPKTNWLPVFTELYNSSIAHSISYALPPSLEWRVGSSSRGNNCHAVHRSLSSSASVCDCAVGF